MRQRKVHPSLKPLLAEHNPTHSRADQPGPTFVESNSARQCVVFLIFALSLVLAVMTTSITSAAINYYHTETRHSLSNSTKKLSATGLGSSGSSSTSAEAGLSLHPNRHSDILPKSTSARSASVYYSSGAKTFAESMKNATAHTPKNAKYLIGGRLMARKKEHRNSNIISISGSNKNKRGLRVRCKSYGDSRPNTPLTECYGDNAGMVPYVASLFDQAGFTFVNDDDWDLLWYFLPQRRYKSFADKFDGLFTQQGVDHPQAPLRLHCDDKAEKNKYAGLWFPGAGDKCRLIPYLQSLRPLKMYIDGTGVFNLNLPSEMKRLEEAMEESKQDVWLLKACIGKKGRGQNFVTRKDIEGGKFSLDASAYVVAQPYLNSPALFEGKKFHLRLFILITDYSEGIRAYIAKEGLLKTSKEPFEPITASVLADLSSEERGEVLNKANKYHVDVEIKNRRISEYFLTMGKEAGEELWNSITSDIGRILSCISSRKGPYEHRNYGRCFDFFGLDVIFDASKDGRPVPKLLEVNLGPMMGSVRGDDQDLKMKKAILSKVVDFARSDLQSTESRTGTGRAKRIRIEEQILLSEFEKLPTAVNEKEQCGGASLLD